MEKEFARVAEDKLATEYLANERTFLAWIRTSIALISLGFVVARFGLWLHELAASVTGSGTMQASGASSPIGISMVAAGGVFALLAAWRYHAVNRAIERGAVKADRTLIALVAGAVILVAAAMVVYMLALAKTL